MRRFGGSRRMQPTRSIVRLAVPHLRLACGALATALAIAANACMSAAGAPATSQGTPSPTATGTATGPTDAWPVIARDHLDLWLHGYALLTRDTATIPYFERGYRDRMIPIKNK